MSKIIAYFLIAIGAAAIIIGGLYSLNRSFAFFTISSLLPGYGLISAGILLLIKHYWDLPNAITISRLLVVPPVILLLLPGLYNAQTAFIAAALYSIAGLSDIMDGFLARRMGVVSTAGKFLDPLADKIVYITVLICLIPMNSIPIWIVLLVVTRELYITGLRGVAVSEGLIIQASRGGKIKTSFGTIGITGLLIHYAYTIDFFVIALKINFQIVGIICTYISVFFSILSAIDYTRKFMKAQGKNSQDTNPDSSDPQEELANAQA